LTAQGHSRVVFNRAIERGSLAIAETTLRELGRPTLSELLELTIPTPVNDPRRHAKVSTRWLLRYPRPGMTQPSTMPRSLRLAWWLWAAILTPRLRRLFGLCPNLRLALADRFGRYLIDSRP
jgi:hypothetical protein